MTPKVGIIGSGPAALITAYVLIQDGFTDVQLVTRDREAGGIWAKSRVYPGLSLNNVYGQFRFSSMEMKPPPDPSKTGGRLTGEVMSEYMESFADKFLRGRIKYASEVLKIRRGANKIGWMVKSRDLETNTVKEDYYSKIVLCTGGCTNPDIPLSLSPHAAKSSGFPGIILHSSQFSQELPTILAKVKPSIPGSDTKSGRIVIIGSGKSAQDMATYLTNQGRKVTMVYEHLEPYLASTRPRPAILRQSRIFSILSPYATLRSRLERFCHTTWLGSLLIRFIFKIVGEGGFKAYKLAEGSPLRKVESFFWQPRLNDSGVVHPRSFYGLAASGKIDLCTPARAAGYSNDGCSVLLKDGRKIPADVVILATGYRSSWENLFDDETAEEVGIRRRVLPRSALVNDEWKSYVILQNRPEGSLQGKSTKSVTASSIYRGIVPAKNILKRDFAINGAILTGNAGYAFEVVAHWISSYFLGDKMKLPSTPEAALAEADRHSAWCEKRFPGALGRMNESISSAIHIWSWPQAMDELLEDMHLPSCRSGGEWYNWMLKVIDLQEIANLTEERRALREAGRL
ncbi:hypothetical protein AN958_02777 [Leucoagaricus sp. SymC.cos]|nr:hypothetical protein AN958_02777 [Leucoagaricus sp. SymC.cos]